MNSGLFTTSGLRLRLGKSLGKGGEANIFRVESDRPTAVKLYIEGKAAERHDKVIAMISDRLFERTSFVAFPIEAVTSKGTFVGFTMRQAIGAKPLHQLCTPGDRKAEFPDATFRFLVRVALNFARAMASIYELGAVIGDINESVALVDQKGLVTVVDSDSFQYRRRGQLYRCLVGKAEYTPPELQGQPVGNIDLPSTTMPLVWLSLFSKSFSWVGIHTLEPTRVLATNCRFLKQSRKDGSPTPDRGH